MPTILVADDDPWAARALCGMLDQEDDLVALQPTWTGTEAVTAYREHRPDLVLMDLNMPPGISGVEATETICREDPDARVIILSTAAPGPGFARALDAGAMAAVRKTAAPTTVLRTLRAALAEDSPRLLRGLAEEVLLSGDLIPGAPATFSPLTHAEVEVLRHVCEGREYAQIAEQLYISPNTVKTHARVLREKLHAGNLAQLLLQAMRYGYVSAGTPRTWPGET